MIRGALTGTHTGTQSLAGHGLVRENLDPDLTATAGITGHGHTGGLDLVAGNPGGLGGLEAPLAVSDLIAAAGGAGHAAAVDAAVLYSLRQQHYWAPPSLGAGAEGRGPLGRGPP